MVLTVLSAKGSTGYASRFSLDSIAAWGQFPNFCVKTYRWGDKFFNSYDPQYVIGTGKRFNIKYKNEIWSDFYNFQFANDDRTRMMMMSTPTETMGFWLTYMAVSVGYDINTGKYFGGSRTTSKRFNFQFNCSPFAAELYYFTNNQGTKIKRFGPVDDSQRMDMTFRGVNNEMMGLDLYYFFNHKNYSQAAAFSFSKIQRKSSGSFFAGLSLSRNENSFDFNQLPSWMKKQLPLKEFDYHYRTKNNTYAVRIGYGYNFVAGRHWTFGLSESPNLGVSRGWILNFAKKETTFSLYNHLKASAVFNSGKWFSGLIFTLDNGLIYNKQHAMIGSNFNLELSVGYRFDLWSY